MPRFNMRPLLLLSTFILLYHWAFGLPMWPRRQGQQPAQIALHGTPKAHELLSKPWKKRIVALGGKGVDRVCLREK
jgi:hypothetical protein